MKKKLSILALAVLTTAALATASAAPQNTEVEQDTVCEAYVYPDSARARSEPVEVRARLSADIGEVTTVEADDESGLAVGAVEITEADSIVVSLDTSSAIVGSWTLRFKSDQGVCTANWTVEADSASGR